MGKVLLTGGSGFVASHILLELLKHNHTVVTTVRSSEKADALRAIVPTDAASRVTYAIVEDVAHPEAFKKVLSEHTFDGVMHTAMPYHLQNTEPGELMDPAIKGTRSLLQSVKSYAPTVKRFVITSSHAAVIDILQGKRPHYVYTAEDWNPIDWNTANMPNPVFNYLGAKKFSELAAWEFVKEYPELEVTAICAPSVYGPLLIPPSSPSAMNLSSAFIYSYVSGALKDGDIPEQHFHGWVDVRNVAQAHVKAYETSAAANQRYILSAGSFTHVQISNILLRNFPSLKDNIPVKVPGADTDKPTLNPDGSPIGGCHSFDAGPSEKELGLVYIGLEQSLVDSVEAFKEFRFIA